MSAGVLFKPPQVFMPDFNANKATVGDKNLKTLNLREDFDLKKKQTNLFGDREGAL